MLIANPVGMRMQLKRRPSAREEARVRVRSAQVEEALRLTREGRCYACGELVEAALAELGSPLCHDCRCSATR